MLSCRSEAATTEHQLHAAHSEAAALAVSQAQLQHQLAEVESQKQHSHSEQAMAEHRLQQLQVLSIPAVCIYRSNTPACAMGFMLGETTQFVDRAFFEKFKGLSLVSLVSKQCAGKSCKWCVVVTDKLQHDSATTELQPLECSAQPPSRLGVE